MIVSLRDAVPENSGGKAGALGALCRADMPVPDGFVITFDDYRAARSTMPGDPLSPRFLEMLARELDKLGDQPVAVLSSASSEDTADISAAGQYDSILAVRGVERVAAAVRDCWASFHSARAIAYHAGVDHPADDPAMAVLVQHLVDADTAGVMFTPADARGSTRIEASWGLGPSVVEGRVTPDTYSVTAAGWVDRIISDKATRVDRDGTRLVTRTVPEVMRRTASLDTLTTARLARLGRDIADLLGGPQDVEWAIAGGRVWILQARPVTAPPPPPPRAAASPVRAAMLTGTPGSPGTATGLARIIRSPGDFARVRPGDILVCPHTDPAWTPLLRIAAGVVTETGGALSHAAIVARERRIPAVLGVPHATTRISDGAHIVVDGSAGSVDVTEG